MGRLGAVWVMGLSRLRWLNFKPDDVDEILLIAEDADGVDTTCSSTVGVGGTRSPGDECYDLTNFLTYALLYTCHSFMTHFLTDTSPFLL